MQLAQRDWVNSRLEKVPGPLLDQAVPGLQDEAFVCEKVVGAEGIPCGVLNDL